MSPEIDPYLVQDMPYYRAVADEVELYEAAYSMKDLKHTILKPRSLPTKPVSVLKSPTNWYPSPNARATSRGMASTKDGGRTRKIPGHIGILDYTAPVPPRSGPQAL